MKTKLEKLMQLNGIKSMDKPDTHDLADENKLLRAQVQALSDREEFLEDCIAEMAVQVYGG